MLYRSLQNFLASEHAKVNRKKRGGDFAFVAWDDLIVDAPSQLCIPLRAIERWSAEKVFDYRWAATVAEQALRRLGQECEAAGRRRVFDS